MLGEEPLPPSQADAAAPPARFGTGDPEKPRSSRSVCFRSIDPRVPGPDPSPDYFNLISRNRSSRYPCAVIGSG